MTLLSISTSQPKPLNPYIGPRPFEESDRERFFGRDIEARDIVSSVIANRIFILYAQSGAGKTSILNARLLPLLREKGLDPLPPTRVTGIDALTHDNWQNIYISNVLTKWSEDIKVEINPETSLQHFLLTQYPRKLDEDGELIPRVISIDQFEELFTGYPHRWRDREDFFKQLTEILNADPFLRVLLIMREDYLAQLDPYVDLFADRLRARGRLERLRRNEALSSIINPLKATYRHFAVGAAEQLVDDLLQTQVELPDGKTIPVKGEFIEPVHLQVVCYRLWESLPDDIVEISTEYINSSGNVDQALKSFYFSCIHSAYQETRIPEIDLRQWVETNLITSAGTRSTVYVSSRDNENNFSRAIRILEDMHLIRSEIRSGARWYELTHDRLIKPILDTRTTQEYGETTARIRNSTDRIEFRQLEVSYVFERWKAAESVSLVGVGSVGKSNLLQHLCNPTIHEAYLGHEQVTHFKAVLIDPSMTVPAAGKELSEALNCWTGYELLLHRLYLALYPFDMLNEQTAQQFYETYQAFQDGTNPLYAVLGLRYFELAVEMVVRAGIQLVFVLDDFDILLRQMPVKFFITLRGLRDRNKSRVSYLTYTRTSLADLASQLDIDALEIEPFIELFTENEFYVTRYNEQDAHDMIQALMRRNQKNFDKTIINFVLWASGRFPGLLRAIFRSLTSLYDLPAVITSVDREKLLLRLSGSKSVQAENQTIWSGLSQDERTILLSIRTSNKQLEINPRMEQAVSLLVQKGLIQVNREATTLDIDPPIFRVYVHQQIR